MATKKTFLGAKKAPQKPMPKKGDVVWVDDRGIMGVFYCYDSKIKSLVLTWPGHSILVPYIWPRSRAEFHPVEEKDIRILSPEEILGKIDYFMRLRDAGMRDDISRAVDEIVAGPAFRL